MRGELDFRGKNELGSLDDFYAVVRKVLANSNFFACSISISYDNMPVHNYSETDVSSSFHVIYKIDRKDSPVIFRNSHRIYKGDRETNQNLFDALKSSFIANVLDIVDQRKYNLNKFDFSNAFTFAVSRA